jgi:hypothetical protein
MAGHVVVADPGRTERLSDGRLVSVGKSWPGAFDICVVDVEQPVLPNCYREPVSKGAIIKQPMSTASALALIVVGLVILFVLARAASSNTAGVGSFYGESLGFVALAMGPGSILFHATLTAWGGWLDQMSMYLLLGFMVAYGAGRATRRGIGTFIAVYVSFLCAAVVATVAVGLLAFIVTALLVSAFEIVLLYSLLARAATARSTAVLGRCRHPSWCVSAVACF